MSKYQKINSEICALSLADLLLSTCFKFLTPAHKGLGYSHPLRCPGGGDSGGLGWLGAHKDF